VLHESSPASPRPATLHSAAQGWKLPGRSQHRLVWGAELGKVIASSPASISVTESLASAGIQLTPRPALLQAAMEPGTSFAWVGIHLLSTLRVPGPTAQLSIPLCVLVSSVLRGTQHSTDAFVMYLFSLGLEINRLFVPCSNPSA
jgi:hypothetical protein